MSAVRTTFKVYTYKFISEPQNLNKSSECVIKFEFWGPQVALSITQDVWIYNRSVSHDFFLI
jgi:hypothetical protein